MNNELTPEEHHFIEVVRTRIGNFPHDISTITSTFMRSGGLYNTGDLLESLINKNILDLSPDKSKVKWTTYGLEQFCYFKERQSEWEKKLVKTSSDLDNDEVHFSKGDYYKPSKFILDLLRSATKTIQIEDKYLNNMILDILADYSRNIPISVLTRNLPQEGSSKNLLTLCRNLQRTKSNIEIRYSSELHPRYVIIDESAVWNFSESLKELGNKDGNAKRIKNKDKILTSFKQKWKNASN